MGILPKNEPRKPVETPKNFLVYGASKSGKSYLAGEFPNPIFLNTDGNAEQNEHPFVMLRNERNSKGGITQSVVDILDETILELETTNHGFETVIIDVTEDLIDLLEDYVSADNDVETIGDIGFGKGYAAVNSLLRSIVIKLKSLPYYTVWISRINTYTDQNGRKVEEPALSQKYMNIIDGNSDFLIHTEKNGKSYLRVCKDKRKNYDPDKIEDKRIVKILETINGALPKPASKTVAETGRTKPQIKGE